MPIHDWSKVPANVFHSFHTSWITFISGALNRGLLPQGFISRAEQHMGEGIADVLTLRREALEEPTPSRGVALAERRPATTYSGERRVPRTRPNPKHVAIRRSDGLELVAVVEVVSPGNKDNRHGIAAFVRKSKQLLKAGLNLLVLDLIKPGPRDPEGLHPMIWGAENAFALPAEKKLTLASYVGGEWRHYFLEVGGVGDLMPEMPLFLSEELYVEVPLQRTYDAAFELMADEDQASVS